MAAGRERQYDITLDNMPFVAVRDSNGPIWKSDPVPALSNQSVTIAEIPREYRSWHWGFGYSQVLVPNTYHYTLNLDCLVPSTPVTSSSPIRGAARRWYEGEVIHLTTASGHEITATPNHPILTDRGWVSIGLINEGDNVIRYVGTDRMSLGRNDVQYMDTPIGEIFSSLSLVGATQRVPASIEQFHGDGQNGNVDIVTINSQLRNGVKASSAHPIYQFNFPRANMCQSDLIRDGLIDAPMRPATSLPNRLMHSMCHMHLLFWRHLGNLHAFGLRTGAKYMGILKNLFNHAVIYPILTAQRELGSPMDILSNNGFAVNRINGPDLRDSRRSKYHSQNLRLRMSSQNHARGAQQSPNTPSANMKSLGEIVNTPASDIGIDKVVGINRTHYAGHVYNLHTQSECYLADSIVSHNCRFPRQGIMGPQLNSVTIGGSTNVSGFFEQSGNFYVLAGRYCKQLSSHVAQTPDAGVAGKDFGAGAVATVGRNFDGSTFVYFSSSTYIWKFTGAASGWSQSSDTYATFGDIFQVDPSFVLAGTYTNSTNPSVRWVARGSDPVTAANYGTSYVIGESTTAITGATTWDMLIFISKSDGLYVIDKTGLGRRVLKFPTTHSNNGKGMWCDPAGIIWIPTMAGYLRFDPRTNDTSDCSPGFGQPNASPIYGRVTAAAEHRGWHYAWVYNGTSSYLMAGRPRQEGEPGYSPMVWSGALAVVTGSVDACYVNTTASPPELWYGIAAEAGYFLLPSNGDNPLLDSAYLFCLSGSLYMPADDWNMPGTRFAFTGLDNENEGLSTVTYADALIQLDDGAWQTFQRLDSRGYEAVVVPNDGDWRFSKAALRIDVTNAVATSTPKFRSFVMRAIPLIRTRDVISTTLYCSDDAISKMGTGMRLTGQEQLDKLRLLEEAGPVTIETYWTGQVRRQRVIIHPVHMVIVAQSGDEPARLAAQVTMSVLDDQATPAYYGSAVYGSDRYS